MINTIKRILEYFVCQQFINEKFQALRVSRDMILLHSKYESIKGFKRYNFVKYKKLYRYKREYYTTYRW